MPVKRLIQRYTTLLPTLVLLTIFLVLTGTFNVAAQQPDFEPKFFEDFEGDPLENWILDSCSIVELEGSRVLGCSPPINAIAQSFSLALLESEFLEEPFMVRYRVKTGGGGLRTNLMVDPGEQRGGHYITVLSAGEGLMRSTLYRQFTGEEEEPVARTDLVDFNPDSWYQVEVTFQEGILRERIFLEDEPLLGLRFSGDRPVSPGFLAFQVSAGEIFIDDVEIWGPTEVVPPPEDFYLFSGQVFLGEPENRSTPLEGIQVVIFGANNPHPAEGEYLDATFTDREGFFELRAPAGFGFEFYAVRLLDTGEFQPIFSQSISGISQDPDWIEHSLPLVREELAGNDFFVIPRQPEISVLAGRVVVGEPGAEFEPLEGVAVAVFGANNPYPDEGDYLGDMATGPGGFYELSVPGGYEYYSIRLFPPDYYIPIEANSDGGIVRAADWIEYLFPFDNRPIDGNEFIVRYVDPQQPGRPTWDYPRCEANETLLAQNDFENGNTDGWELGDGWWTESNLLVTDTSTFAIYPAADWNNYRVQLGMIIPDEGSGLLIHLHQREDQQYSYLVEPGFTALAKIVGGEEIHSDSQGITLEPGQWFEMEAGASEGRFWVAINDEIVLEAEDPDPLSGGTIVVILVLGGAVLGGGSYFFRGPVDPANPGKLLPPTPGLPPIRLANAWLSQGSGGQGKPLRDDFTITSQDSYTLHVQIQPRQQAPRDGDVQTPNYPLDAPVKKYKLICSR
jgi:hypothetical protein